MLQMLRGLVDKANHGDRLPTVRALMHRYRVSQKAVEQCFAVLAAEGLIASHVGRGTFALKGGQLLFDGAARSRSSVLLLTRNVGSARTRRVLSRLQDELSAHMVESVQVTYNEISSALSLLRSLPRFDLCIVQCHFEPISIELLALLRHKAKAILFDGATVSGLDIDSVGSDWRNGLELAIRELAAKGHRRIGMIGSAWKSPPIEALRRHYASLRPMAPWGLNLQEPVWLQELPTEGALLGVEETMAAIIASGSLPFTALIIWGALEGRILRQIFARLGVRIPADLSVMILGHQGVATESDGFFSVAGTDLDETVNTLLRAALARLADPRRPPRHEYLGAGLSAGQSVQDLSTI